MFNSVVKAALVLFMFLFLSGNCLAWDGYDYDSGSHIEIGEGNLVRQGSDIEIYDYSTGEYRDVEVHSVREYGGSVEVEVYDHETGEYRELEMDN